MRKIEEIKADMEMVYGSMFEDMHPNTRAVTEKMISGFEDELRAVITSDIPLARLEQLAQAEREQRAVVLKCKPGDTLFVIAKCESVVMHCDNDYITGTGAVDCPFENACDIEECNDRIERVFETVCAGYMWGEGYQLTYGLHYFAEHINIDITDSDFGKTVFTTREAAQAALDGKGAGVE